MEETLLVVEVWEFFLGVEEAIITYYSIIFNMFRKTIIHSTYVVTDSIFNILYLTRVKYFLLC